MAIERVKEYFRQYGMEERIIELKYSFTRSIAIFSSPYVCVKTTE